MLQLLLLQLLLLLLLLLLLPLDDLNAGDPGAPHVFVQQSKEERAGKRGGERFNELFPPVMGSDRKCNASQDVEFTTTTVTCLANHADDLEVRYTPF
ncbi:unnamed protein product [Lampetra fluviatilis]